MNKLVFISLSLFLSVQSTFAFNQKNNAKRALSFLESNDFSKIQDSIFTKLSKANNLKDFNPAIERFNRTYKTSHKNFSNKKFVFIKSSINSAQIKVDRKEIRLVVKENYIKLNEKKFSLGDLRSIAFPEKTSLIDLFIPKAHANFFNLVSHEAGEFVGALKITTLFVVDALASIPGLAFCEAEAAIYKERMKTFAKQCNASLLDAFSSQKHIEHTVWYKNVGSEEFEEIFNYISAKFPDEGTCSIKVQREVMNRTAIIKSNAYCLDSSVCEDLISFQNCYATYKQLKAGFGNENVVNNLKRTYFEDKSGSLIRDSNPVSNEGSSK